MRKLYFLLFFALGCKLWAQEKDYPTIAYDRWMIDFGVTHQFALNDLSLDPVTDNLFSYGSATYIELFSGTYFFNQQWGLNLDFQLGAINDGVLEREERFQNSISDTFGDQYYITKVSLTEFGRSNESSVIGGTSLGLVYRYEKARFTLLSSFDIGFRAFKVTEEAFLLKEIGTNRILNLSYTADGASGFLTTFSPRAKLMYQVKNDFYLKLDVNYSLLVSDFIVLEEFKDTVTDELTIRRIDYGKALHTIGFGIGFAFFL